MAESIGLYSASINKEIALEMAILSKEVYKSKPQRNAPDDMAILTSLKQRNKNYLLRVFQQTLTFISNET